MKTRRAIVIPLLVACALLASTFSPAFALTSSDIQVQQSQLERQLKEIESQIASYERQLKTIASRKNTLANKIAQLHAQQAELALKIKATRALIEDLTAKIDETQTQITAQDSHLTELKGEMAADLQALYKQDRRSIVEILLTEKDLSDFFAKVDSYEKLGSGLDAIVGQVKTVTAALEDRQRQLSDQRQQQQNLVSIVDLQSQQLDATLADESTILRKTKGQEANYQNALKDSKQQAADIKNRIYQLVQVGKQVTFGEALQVAQWASAETGVRPAFLLAILTQESNLGANVGTCNRAGDPPSKSWRVIMKPSRDQGPFRTITSELGLPIDTTPVSCPMHDRQGNQIGWGGAMGPAQFIPSTWMGYRGKVSAITGHPANPWDMRDAFLAAAILLRANGAGTQSGEWAAAMRYFSGSTNPAYRFYGDSVVAQAAKYQQDINQLNGQ